MEKKELLFAEKVAQLKQKLCVLSEELKKIELPKDSLDEESWNIYFQKMTDNQSAQKELHKQMIELYAERMGLRHSAEKDIPDVKRESIPDANLHREEKKDYEKEVFKMFFGFTD